MMRQWSELGEVMVVLKGAVWPVRVRQREGIYEVCGRASLMQVHVARTEFGLLVSIPNTNNCGFVPEDCSGRDIQQYCRMKNGVDAETVAAGVRFLVERGMV